jgi:hypothetical protein
VVIAPPVGCSASFRYNSFASLNVVFVVFMMRYSFLRRKCGVSVAKASSGASSSRELISRIIAALNKAGLKNTDDPDPRDMKKVLKKQEALADLDGIDPSNIVETSGRPRRAAAAKVDYRAVLKIEGLDSEDRCAYRIHAAVLYCIHAAVLY